MSSKGMMGVDGSIARGMHPRLEIVALAIGFLKHIFDHVTICPEISDEQ